MNSDKSYSEPIISTNEYARNEDETNLEKLLCQAEVIERQLKSLTTSLNYIEHILDIGEEEMRKE